MYDEHIFNTNLLFRNIKWYYILEIYYLIWENQRKLNYYNFPMTIQDDVSIGI